jgi:hypothetical protein
MEAGQVGRAQSSNNRLCQQALTRLQYHKLTKTPLFERCFKLLQPAALGSTPKRRGEVARECRLRVQALAMQVVMRCIALVSGYTHTHTHTHTYTHTHTHIHIHTRIIIWNRYIQEHPHSPTHQTKTHTHTHTHTHTSSACSCFRQRLAHIQIHEVGARAPDVCQRAWHAAPQVSVFVLLYQ